MEISQEEFRNLMLDRTRLEYLLFWADEDKCSLSLRDSIDHEMVDDKVYQEHRKKFQHASS